MASTVYPFPAVSQEAPHRDDADCTLSQLLGRKLQEASDDEPHLKQYLHFLPLREIGIPTFVPKLTRGMKEMNVIYPVGDRTFVHVFNDPEDSRNWYLPIEPTLLADMDDLVKELDIVLLDYVEHFKDAETDEARREALLMLIEKICQVERNPPDGKRRKGKRLRVTASELTALRYLIIRDKIGLGRLQPLISDPYVEDISCSGAGPLFLEHKIFKACKASITFERTDELDDFVLRMSERIKKPVTFRKPIVDASLPDGSRINIVFGSDVSKRGSNFTIRKFADIPMSVIELIVSGSLSYEVAAYLWDRICAGGDAGSVGYYASRYAMHIQLLHAKRALVAATFGWLMLPMHMTLVAPLAFITEIFPLFSGEIVKAQNAGLSESSGIDGATLASVPTSDVLGFGSLDMTFVRTMVMVVIISLTLVNGFVTNAASGGDRYRLCYTTSMMAILSGGTLLIVPVLVDLIFGGIL